ncbi:MAG: bifunctional oligoribonuclease/PAP phosphatase NrnA [Armatimonadetes bacterium]|nr:bifunctional oligoribonuclease/PAP phosphatase NrnA [Armatimonadota bacterium]MDW8027771.1 bifunctional oligoribonuclease/PAP phosphatase NrnA [Armatimonadota bacterium]
MKVPVKVLQQLLSHQKILIASHVGPEGDAIGSALALSFGLEKIGKTVEVICHKGIPKRYDFLPNADKIKSQPSLEPELLVLVDCSELSRADLPKEFQRIDGLPILVIDHHPEKLGRKSESEIKWVNPEAAATAEMIYQLLKVLKVPMTVEIATCLYAGLISDTGVFQFRNTKPETLRLAASLLKWGLDPQDLAYRIWEVRSFEATKLLARMLVKAKFEPEIGLSWSAITVRDFHQTGTNDEDTENFVNFLRSVNGTRVAVLFREVEKNFVKVSLRSKDGTDVAAIALRFGGGGHRAAAGCKLNSPLPSAVKQVLREVRKALANSKG